MLLGEQYAENLGFNIRRLRIVLLIITQTTDRQSHQTLEGIDAQRENRRIEWAVAQRDRKSTRLNSSH